MSNTQRPKAAMNGAKHPGQHAPSQAEVLAMIAGGIQALAQDATRRPVVKDHTWHCAICLGFMRAWEIRHAGKIEEIAGLHATATEAWLTLVNDPETDQDAKLQLLGQQPNLQAMCQQYGQAQGDPMPPVNEAQFIVTLPGVGTCSACAIHVPPAEIADPARTRLLAVSGALSTALVAAARHGTVG